MFYTAPLCGSFNDQLLFRGAECGRVLTSSFPGISDRHRLNVETWSKAPWGTRLQRRKLSLGLSRMDLTLALVWAR